ncbi:MAG: ABC transporter ATP-binding protein [Kiritimatiellae bacterium]|nr:ABC transporter ATP-binding protein [Kiritimatiellia bacterium]
MESLNASGVCRRYGKQEVLKDFSLKMASGSFEALMGPSGSGKSTFLHLAAGLLSADAGEILVGGNDVAKMGDSEATKFRRRHIGVVFQSFNLLNERTVRDNIVLPLRLDGAKVDEERFASLVSALGIDGILKKKPEELSGGEQQRVAVARALLAEPDVVLADEPTGNLDAKSSRAICALLGDLHRTEKSAILVVTHDPQVAAAAQKVHFLKDGRIAASYATEGDAEMVSKRYLETYRG